jgi:hypothetical protein
VIPFERNPGDARRPGREPDLGFDREVLLEHRALPETRKPAAPPAHRGAWLLAPLILCAIAAALLFVMRGPDRVFGLAFGLVIGLGFSWILVSVLFPSRADRTCPQCGRKGLVRIDPKATHGLRCRFCPWSDETASAFVHAEEEGPLEDIVLRERRRGQFRRW